MHRFSNRTRTVAIIIWAAFIFGTSCTFIDRDTFIDFVKGSFRAARRSTRG